MAETDNSAQTGAQGQGAASWDDEDAQLLAEATADEPYIQALLDAEDQEPEPIDWRKFLKYRMLAKGPESKLWHLERTSAPWGIGTICGKNFHKPLADEVAGLRYDEVLHGDICSRCIQGFEKEMRMPDE